MSADALPLLAGDLVLVADDRLLRVLEAAAVVVHRVIEQRHLLSELLRGLEIEIVLETRDLFNNDSLYQYKLEK